MANRIVRSQAARAGATAPAVSVSGIVAAVAALGFLATASVAAAQQRFDGAKAAGPAPYGGPLVQRNTPPAGIDMRALLNDPLIREFRGLSENTWDFTDPYGVPGFGPMPTPSQGGVDR